MSLAWTPMISAPKDDSVSKLDGARTSYEFIRGKVAFHTHTNPPLSQ